MFKKGDLVELTKEFESGDINKYPKGSLGVVVETDSPPCKNDNAVLWVHFQTGYVGALYAKRVRKIN